MLEFKFDTQLLIQGENLSEDDIFAYISSHIKGDSLLAIGDEDLIKIHFHTNEPWQVLEYCSTLGDIHDIVVENMQRQQDGLQG
ncbi:MAG: kinase to dihydroxyacetone kinase [Oscillospiraceae bacterium]|nr:kinase to dihydroxyacetone kinase [Oscillospiraceae bacterium]